MLNNLMTHKLGQKKLRIVNRVYLGDLKPQRSRPTNPLRENQNKEKELSLKIASSLIFSWNASSQQEF